MEKMDQQESSVRKDRIKYDKSKVGKSVVLAKTDSFFHDRDNKNKTVFDGSGSKQGNNKRMMKSSSFSFEMENMQSGDKDQYKNTFSRYGKHI